MNLPNPIWIIPPAILLIFWFVYRLYLPFYTYN